jgi:S-DNA-T family DNA segregation ATPase FtsK/SpoIIIE
MIHGVESVTEAAVVERRGPVRRLLAKLAGADKIASRRSAKFSLWEIPQDGEEAEDDAPYSLGDETPTIAAPVLDADEAGAELEDPLDREALEPDGDTALAPRVTTGRKPVVNKKRRKEVPAEQIEIPLPDTAALVNYKLPPLHFLDFDQDDQVEVNASFLQAQARRLVEALRTFRIDGRVTEIHPGPVVTMYEFEPAPGVRISRIAGLADDLAMALKAVKVRIVAPIPGKGVVGFEVPNKTREMVFLKEIIGSKAFGQKKMNLPLALGKDIHGEPMMADLSRMPHLLVAGTTGSGKSVGVNSMITSLLYRHSPEAVRFIMVDPKMLELSIYEGIPHLLLPVVTDPKKASLALKWAVHEMDRRYEVMMSAGVRDLRTYNRKAEAAAARREKAKKKRRAKHDAETEMLPTVDTDRLDDTPQKMPYIVVVIDEFADLMMVAGKEVEYCVARIAQKARAAGIHLILATQRPSTDVITGVIKANFPTRIAFQVSSSIDSRTILSTNGAENLLGMGDMLFMPPGSSRLTRVHGAFVSEDEIRQVVDFIAAQADPEYLDESILIPEDERGGDGNRDDDMDPMYEEAIRVVGRDGRASTSHLQRRLSLGYNRAARIVDQLERDGLVGPGRGAKPREVNRAAINELISRWDQT